MNLRIGSNVFYLQRSQRFFDGIVDDLVQGRSVVTLIPKNIDPHEMWSVLRGILLHRDVDFKEISLCQISEGRAPIIEISDSLQLEWLPPETPHTLINLLGLENLPKVIYLDRFEQMPETNFASWANFLYQWSQANKGLRVKGQDSKCICIFVTAPCIMPYLPQSDVNLAIHWWLGIPSSVEFRLLCRSEEDSQYLDVKSKWREYLLPSIAGNDIYLAEYLWNDLHLDIMQLAKQLQDFAENQGWTENALKQWGSDRLRELTIFDRGSLSNFLPEQFHNLWAQGAIAWTQEYGIELHTAALAVLKRHNELEHRFWRGQASLLLPEIDMIRLGLCTNLTQVYGKDWPSWYVANPASGDELVYDSPLACELGRMELLLRKCGRLRSERHWLPLVSQMRKIRNYLAHYRPIEFSDYESIYRQIDSSDFPHLS